MTIPYEPIRHPVVLEPINVIKAENGKYSKDVPHLFTVYASNNPYGEPVCYVQFQDGPLKEEHIEGVHNEDLLLMVMARLEAFQKGPFACRDNAMAYTHIETALMFLSKRTLERKQRGVEGTNIK